ncbi:hypothetical protein pb186bvf_007679 [Paramecium bursaria]
MSFFHTNPSGLSTAFGRPQKTLNTERVEDQVDITVTVMHNEQKHIISINLSETTTDLYRKLISKIGTQTIKHFQTVNKNLSVDYYLSLENHPLSVFAEMRHLKLEPFITRRCNNDLTIEDFDILKCIGVGGFSRVYLVRKIDTGIFYAMKLIEKGFILRNNKSIIIQNERYVMSISDSPYLAKLYFSFETKYYLVFIMEYCQGGELFYHLRKLKRLQEVQARQYFVQVCKAIEYLHSKGVVYRDIKPENILLDADGYLRLSDFGLAKPRMSREDTAYSFCGSPEYMSPEMLLRDGHNYMVDIYCLGALLYEFVIGSPPFYSRDIESIYESILNESVQFPPQIPLSQDLKNLISKLLVKDPSQRLGSQRGVREILEHQWFKSFDFNALKSKKLHMVYKPIPLKYNFDQKEFSKGDEEFRAKLSDNMYREKQGKYTKHFQDFDFKAKEIDHREQILKSKHRTPIAKKNLTLQGMQTLGNLPRSVQSVKGSSNVSQMLMQSFRAFSNSKRFNTEVEMQKYFKSL